LLILGVGVFLVICKRLYFLTLLVL